jgi:hypothetical protein
VDTDNDEIDNGFKISDILTDAGVMQMEIMELVTMNGGLKYCMVNMAVVVVEQT